MRKRMPDEIAANKADLSPRETFKTQTYHVMIDSLLAEVDKRMKAYDYISKTFRFLSEPTSLNIEQIEDRAKILVFSYPGDSEDTLVPELQRRIQEFGMGEAGFPFPDLPSPLLLPLRSRPLNPESGSTVSSPTRVWSGAPAKIKFGAF